MKSPTVAKGILLSHVPYLRIGVWMLTVPAFAHGLLWLVS